MLKPKLTLKIIPRENKKAEEKSSSSETNQSTENSGSTESNQSTENRCKGKEGQCFNQFVCGTMCQGCWNDLFENTRKNYPDYIELVEGLFELAKTPSNLFITRNSHMIDMWDFDRNIEYIEEITYGVGREIHFKCPKGHTFSGPLKDKIRNIYKCDHCKKKKPIPENNEKIVKDKCKNNNCSNEISSGTMCLPCWEELYNLTEKNYPEHVETVKGLFNLALNTNKNLFIKYGSEMIKLWNFHKNTEDIQTITYGSGKKIHFKCLDCDGKHESFESMSQKTSRKYKCELCKNNLKGPTKTLKNKDNEKCKGNKDCCSNKRISGTLCQECWNDLFEKTERNYPKHIEKVKSFYKIALLPSNLFIKMKTEMIYLWNFDKNTEDLAKMTQGTNIKGHFKCHNNDEIYCRIGGKINSCSKCKSVKKDQSLSSNSENQEQPDIQCKGNKEKCPNKAVRGTMCNDCWNLLFKNTEMQYPEFLERVKNLFILALKSSPKAFIRTHSEWIDMWDFNKNKEKIENITYGSGKEIHFKCLGNHEYYMPLKDRIRSAHKCFKCERDKPSEKEEVFIENKCKNENCINKMENGTMCLKCWDELYEITSMNYPEHADVVKNLSELVKKTDKNLFIKTHSEMIKMWNFYKNVENIETITTSSAKNIHFKCQNCDEKFESYEPMTNETANKFKCQICKKKPKKQEFEKIEKIVIENQCKGKNYTCMNVAYSGTFCMECWNNLYETIQEKYPNFLNVVKECFQIALETKENLFIKTNTDLIQYWNFERNNENIRKIGRKSTKNIYFKCFDGHETYPIMSNKTRYNFSCKECRQNSDRYKEREKIVEQSKSNENKKSTTRIGDEAEEYVKKMLEDTGYYLEVERLGGLGGNADLKINYQNIICYVQVKTISEEITKRTKDRYSVNLDKKYPDDMLMIFISNNRERFAACFYHEIKHLKRVGFSFSAKKSKYSNMMFKDKEKLNLFLKENIPLSTKTIKFSPTQILEMECLERLETIAEELGLIYKRNMFSGDAVDCYINNYKIQVKYKSFYEIGISQNISKKAGRRKDGTVIKRPYDYGDFDFLIFEYGGIENENNKYKGIFLIIPVKQLLENDIITGEKSNGQQSKGKTTLHVYPPDSKNVEWYSEYWNNFDQLF